MDSSPDRVAPGMTIALNAEARDDDGNLSSLQFYAKNITAGGGWFPVGPSISLSGTQDTATYAWTAPSTLGTYKFHFGLWDTLGERHDDNPNYEDQYKFDQTIVASDPPRPLSMDSSPDRVAPGASITLTGVARDDDGNLSSLQFYAKNITAGGGWFPVGPSISLSGTEDTATYAWTAPSTLGTYKFHFGLWDTLGKTHDQNANYEDQYKFDQTQVADDPPRPISMDANPATVHPGQSVTLTGVARDDDGDLDHTYFVVDYPQSGFNWLVASSVIGLNGYDQTFSATWTAPSETGTFQFHFPLWDEAGNTHDDNTVHDKWKFDSIQVVNNQPPSVSLSANDTTPSHNQTITYTANASDADGTISSVKFYRDGSLVHTDVAAPYQYSYAGQGGASHSVYAKATDDDGAATNSSAINLSWAIGIALNASPYGSSGAIYESDYVKLSATISPSGLPIDRVEIYNNVGELLISDGEAPYEVYLYPLAEGAYPYEARVFDSSGQIGSATASFSVQPLGSVPGVLDTHYTDVSGDGIYDKVLDSVINDDLDLSQATDSYGRLLSWNEGELTGEASYGNRLSYIEYCSLAYESFLAAWLTNELGLFGDIYVPGFFYWSCQVEILGITGELEVPLEQGKVYCLQKRVTPGDPWETLYYYWPSTTGIMIIPVADPVWDSNGQLLEFDPWALLSQIPYFIRILEVVTESSPAGEQFSADIDGDGTAENVQEVGPKITEIAGGHEVELEYPDSLGGGDGQRGAVAVIVDGVLKSIEDFLNESIALIDGAIIKRDPDKIRILVVAELSGEVINKVSDWIVGEASGDDEEAEEQLGGVGLAGHALIPKWRSEYQSSRASYLGYLNVTKSIVGSTGTVKLIFEDGSEKVKVFDSPSATTPSLGTTTGWQMSQLPQKIYFEGEEVSATKGDIAVKLQYTYQHNGQSVVEYSQVSYATVFDAEVRVYKAASNVASGLLDSSKLEQPGVFLPVNNDDDDYSAPQGERGEDYLQSGELSGENDLVKAELVIRPSLDIGSFQFDSVSFLKVYQLDRTQPITAVNGHYQVQANANYQDEATARVFPILVEATATGSGTTEVDYLLGDRVIDAGSVKLSAFKFGGPLNVPRGGVYGYTVENPPPSGAWESVVAGTMSDATSESVKVTWTSGGTVGSALYRASEDYSWMIEVNVVDLVFESGNGSVQFYWQANYTGFGELGIVDFFFPNPNDDPPIKASISLENAEGPVVSDVERGLRHIFVGVTHLGKFDKFRGIYSDGVSQLINPRDLEGMGWGWDVHNEPWMYAGSRLDDVFIQLGTTHENGAFVDHDFAFDDGPTFETPRFNIDHQESTYELLKFELEFRHQFLVVAGTLSAGAVTEQDLVIRKRIDWSILAYGDGVPATQGAYPDIAWDTQQTKIGKNTNLDDAVVDFDDVPDGEMLDESSYGFNIVDFLPSSNYSYE